MFKSNGINQAPSGTKVIINGTSSGVLIKTQTSGPPGNTGFYASSSLNATDGELISVIAYNNTAFGKSFANLLSNPSITLVNVTMNLSRPGEMNVTIIRPSSNNNYFIGHVFNISISINSIINNSYSCNVTINFSNSNVFNITGYENYTHILGDILLGNNFYNNFSIKAIGIGKSNITVSAYCSNSYENFEGLANFTIYNLAVTGSPPQLHAIEGYIFLGNGITQAPIGTTVTINATQSGSFLTIQTSGPPGHTGFYGTAALNASDGELVIVRAQNATSYGINSTLLLSSPSITLLNVTINTTTTFDMVIENVQIDSDANNINLISDSVKKVTCNATLRDGAAINASATNLSAVFYNSLNSGVFSADDNNNHYTNRSCIISLGNLIATRNISCSFNVWYYADNTSSSNAWICNISAIAPGNINISGSDNISVSDLLSLDIPSTINYGVVDVGFLSSENTTFVRNTGNVKIDLSLDGYGYVDGDGNAMNCTSGTNRNISLSNQRYNLSSASSNFNTEKITLTDTPTINYDFDLAVRQNDLVDDAVKNTYWQIFVPSGVAGTCIGNVVFTAFAG